MRDRGNDAAFLTAEDAWSIRRAIVQASSMLNVPALLMTTAHDVSTDDSARSADTGDDASDAGDRGRTSRY